MAGGTAEAEGSLGARSRLRSRGSPAVRSLRGRSPLCSRSQTSVMCFFSFAASAGRVSTCEPPADADSFDDLARAVRSKCASAASVRSSHP